MPLLTTLVLMSGASTASLVDLRCEYLVNPLSIDSAAPRLSWKAVTSMENWKQGAYQIRVASTRSRLADGEADLWDTGRVVGDRSIQVAYAGKPLTSRERCFWSVRVWDSAGRVTAWSKPQRWDMGLLNPSDWGDSQWIGGNSQGPQPLPAPYLRSQFEAHGKIERAEIYASGLGYAELHLNGKKLGGMAEREPGYTNFSKRALYVVHDVTSQIRQGENALGAILGTGWYDVHDGATWHFERAPWRGRPRMRLALVIDYADGRTQVVTSGPSWRTSAGPILTDGIYTGETYDARRELTGWDNPTYNDSGWQPATVLKAPTGVLAPRPCPPVAITETIKAKRIMEPKPSIYVVDFGQNIAGHVRLNVHGVPGASIRLRYSERVDKAGMIQRSEIETFMEKATPPQPFQTDTYICRGAAREEWEQRFSYSGFRYAEVTGFPGKPSLENFDARLAGTDFETAGEFECSNDLLNRIQLATRYSYRSNAQSIPTDCPQREKNGWTGDAQLAAEAGLMNFKSASFYTKWLNDLADDQQPSGAMSLIVPSGGWGRGGCHPAWDSAFEVIASDLDVYCDDDRGLRQNFDHLKRYVDFLSAQTKDGLVPFDSLGDWLPWSTQTPSQLTSTVFLYVDARIVAKAAKLLGNEPAAAKYSAVADATKVAFDRAYLEPSSIDRLSQTALSMALYFGLADGDKEQRVLAALVANIERQGHLDTGILGAKFVLRTLSEHGRTDLAYRLVASKEQPGWGWWIGQGATTLWEDWKGESSLNHIMFGDVSNWFYQWIAGIGLDRHSQAFHHFLIRPQPVGDLTWAKATEDGPYGRIVSSWRRQGTRFHLDVVVPPNSSATVTLPGHRANGATTLEIGSGTYAFDTMIG